MQDKVRFGNKEIIYTIEWRPRKTMEIRVFPDKSVRVRAPQDAGLEKIRQKVRKRAPWILRQQRFFENYLPKTVARRYVNGETHLYMGRQYLLKIVDAPHNRVRLKGKFLIVETIDRNNVKSQVEKWYAQHARKKLTEIFHEIAPRFNFLGVKLNGLIIRRMQTRWGSCSPKGNITLNPELIKAPRGSIEYVIIHELCHLVHPHHGKEFYALQSRLMPDWEKWKNILEKKLA